MNRNQEKKEAFLMFLEQAKTQIAINPAIQPDQLLLPDYLKNQPAVALNFSYRMGLHDLQVSDEGISATLSFNQQPFFCKILWEQIFSIYFPQDLSQALLFEESLPTGMIPKQEDTKNVLSFQTTMLYPSSLKDTSQATSDSNASSRATAPAKESIEPTARRFSVIKGGMSVKLDS